MAQRNDTITLDTLQQLATQAQLDAVGVSVATPPEGMLAPYTQWLQRGYHGSMHYLARNTALRQEPRALVPDTKSVISALVAYSSNHLPPYKGAPRIAQYAWYKDYHTILKKRLYHLLALLQAEIPSIRGRALVDSAPLYDRYWAVRAGLGWVGKQGLLITQRWGSYVWIGSLLINHSIEPTQGPQPSQCGLCRRCLRACPTGALLQPRLLNASCCIAYRTIEHRTSAQDQDEERPLSLQDTHGWAFGCDACQLCCPFNKHSEKGSLEHEILLTEERLRAFAQGTSTLPRHSPLHRAPAPQLQRLLCEAWDIPFPCTITRNEHPQSIDKESPRGERR